MRRNWGRPRYPNWAIVRDGKRAAIFRLHEVERMRAVGGKVTILGTAPTREEALALLKVILGPYDTGSGTPNVSGLSEQRLRYPQRRSYEPVRERSGFFVGITHQKGKSWAEIVFLPNTIQAPHRWIAVHGPYATQEQAAYVAQSTDLPVRIVPMPRRWGGSKPRPENLGPCRACGSGKGPFRRGFCNACAERARRRGIDPSELVGKLYVPRDRGVPRTIRVILPWKADAGIEYEGQGIAGLDAFEPKVIEGGRGGPGSESVLTHLPRNPDEAHRFLKGFDLALDSDFGFSTDNISDFAKSWRDGYAVGRRLRSAGPAAQTIVREMIVRRIRQIEKETRERLHTPRSAPSSGGRYAARRYGPALPWKQVIDRFVLKDYPAHTTKTPQGRGWYSLWIAGGTIFSYNQPLATKHGGGLKKVYMDPRTFSRTTAKFQNALRYRLGMEGWQIVGRQLERITEPPE